MTPTDNMRHSHSDVFVRDSVTLSPVRMSRQAQGFLEDNDLAVINSAGYVALDDLVDCNQQVFPATFEFLIRKSLGLLYYATDHERLSRRQQKLKDRLMSVFKNAHQFVEEVVSDTGLFMQLYAGTFKLRIKVYTVQVNQVASHIFGEKTFENKIHVLLDSMHFYLVEKAHREILTSSLFAVPLKKEESFEPYRIVSPEKTIRDIYDILSLTPFEVLSARSKREQHPKAGDRSFGLEVIEVDENKSDVKNTAFPRRSSDLLKKSLRSPTKHQRFNEMRVNSSICLGIEGNTSDIKKRHNSFYLSPNSTSILNTASFLQLSRNNRRPLALKKCASLSLSPKKRFSEEKECPAILEQLMLDNQSPSITTPMKRERKSPLGPNKANFEKAPQKFPRSAVKSPEPLKPKKQRENKPPKFSKTISAKESSTIQKEEKPKLIVEEEGERDDESFDGNEQTIHKGALRTYSASHKYGFIVTRENRRAVVLLEELERAGAASRLLERSCENLKAEVRCALQRLNGSNLRIYEAVNIEFC